MLVLCGKTGSGKDTVLNELKKLGMKKVITHTTRPIRKNEVENESYYFTDDEEFLFMRDMGFFLETTTYNVASGETWHYGTSYSAIGNGQDSIDKVIIMNPEGVKVVKEHLELNPVIVYINVTPSVLEERVKKRGDNPDEIQRRISADEDYFKDISQYWDFGVRNEDIDPVTLAKAIYDLYQMKVGSINV